MQDIIKKIIELNSSLSVITLNESGLNSSMKRHRLARWHKGKLVSSICFQWKTHLRFRYTDKLKLKGKKSTFHANNKQKTAWIAAFTSEKKKVFKSKAYKKHKKHCIFSIYADDIINRNIYKPNKNHQNVSRN